MQRYDRLPGRISLMIGANLPPLSYMADDFFFLFIIILLLIYSVRRRMQPNLFFPQDAETQRPLSLFPCPAEAAATNFLSLPAHREIWSCPTLGFHEAETRLPSKGTLSQCLPSAHQGTLTGHGVVFLYPSLVLSPFQREGKVISFFSTGSMISPPHAKGNPVMISILRALCANYVQALAFFSPDQSVAPFSLRPS